MLVRAVNWECSEGVLTKGIFLVKGKTEMLNEEVIESVEITDPFTVRGGAHLLSFVEFCNESPNPSKSTVVPK